jgi:thiamine-phosphate pyrophosphorylase
VFPTSTKQTETISLQTLAEICRAVEIPVVAIGGITAANAGERHSAAGD